MRHGLPTTWPFFWKPQLIDTEKCCLCLHLALFCSAYLLYWICLPGSWAEQAISHHSVNLLAQAFSLRRMYTAPPLSWISVWASAHRTTICMHKQGMMVWTYFLTECSKQSGVCGPYFNKVYNGYSSVHNYMKPRFQSFVASISLCKKLVAAALGAAYFILVTTPLCLPVIAAVQYIFWCSSSNWFHYPSENHS